MPTINPPRYLSLDAWRGLACILLVIFHSSFYMEGAALGESLKSGSVAEILLWCVKKSWIGVPIFFVVSGFCIATSLNRLRNVPQAGRRFVIRRFERIYPPLWAALILALGIWTFACATPELLLWCKQIPENSPTLAHFVGNFTLTDTWLPWHWSGQESALILPNLWTLCLEEQFYFICVIMLAWFPKHLERGFLGVTGLVAAAVAIRFLMGDWAWRGLFLEGPWLLFAAGVAVYYMGNAPANFWKCSLWAGLAGLILLGVVLVKRGATDELKHFGEYSLVAGAFSGLLIAFRKWDASLSASWPARGLAKLGTFSYSIYLTHYPVVVLISALFVKNGQISAAEHLTVVLPTCLLAMLPIAWVFHLLVERHFGMQPAKKPLPTEPSTAPATTVASSQ